MFLPSSVEPTFLKLSDAFTRPTAARMTLLMVGMILCLGRHTVTAALRMVGSLAPGHYSSYHRPLVSRLRADAALYAPAPPRRKHQTGRPRVKGRKIDSPQQATQRKNAPWTTTVVDWYGGGTRRVRLLTGTGLWYNRGRAVPIRWVYVVDLQGTHRDDCVFSTDVTLTPQRIVSLFTRRWSIEVTFEEVRAHLGFETTRQRVAKSVLRTAPCLLGLFSVVSLILNTHQRRYRVRPPSTAWYVKTDITFSDAIATVRRLLWTKTIFGTSVHNDHIAKLPRPLRTLLLDALSRAASAAKMAKVERRVRLKSPLPYGRVSGGSGVGMGSRARSNRKVS